MLTIHDQESRLCDGLTRREWLRVGGLGLLGATLPGLIQSQARARTTGEKAVRKAKACIVLFLLGGPPQHETWDPKPDAPAEVKGELKPIQSSVPGLWVGELMPQTARLAHLTAVLRAVRTGDSAHTSSGYYMCTGKPHQPPGVENALPGAPNDWPSMGSVLKRLGAANNNLPACVTLPEVLRNDSTPRWPGQDGGFLGRSADPWVLNCDPSAGDFKVPELALPNELPALRFDERKALLDQVNRHLDVVDQSKAVNRFNVASQQAFDLLRSQKARRAFDLSQETPAARDRYGRNKFGQSVLLSRRLVEAGVPFVQVTWPRMASALNGGHWDTHSQNAKALKTVLMPPMDQAYSALLEDLQQRGLLDETLVLWMGEFGRTPRHNGAGGRDHWGNVFSVALAGGGVKGGAVHGASDAMGGQPRDGMVQPQDLTATIFHCLGYSPDAEIQDSLGRPIAISRGDLIRPIL